MSFIILYLIFFVITLVGLPKVLASHISYYWFPERPVLWKHLLFSLLLASTPYLNLPSTILTIVGWITILTDMWTIEGNLKNAWWNKPVFKKVKANE